jgi:glycosyltransferase involved in cell wall biosynthesis
VVPSEQTKNDLISLFQAEENKVKVIPLGLSSLPTTTSKSIIDKPYILCVSGLSRRKNIIRLIRAFNDSSIKDYKLVIAGKKGDAYPRILKIVEGDSNIELKTNLETAEIHQLYAHAEFCVYPSVYEGFGIPILESFQHGKTIATSKISSLPEVGGDAALYFNPKSTASMTKVIETLAFSQSHREHLELKIPEQLKKFESESILRSYMSLYQEIS